MEEDLELATFLDQPFFLVSDPQFQLLYCPLGPV